MYSVVLATALMAGGELPNFHRHGCHGCHGCHGNAFSCYASSCHGCYGGGCFGCHGCYSSCSCFGGCYGSCSCFGGCYSSCSFFGGCYSSCSCFGGCYSSCSCFGGYGFSSCFSSCSGGFGSGGVVVLQPQKKLTTGGQQSGGLATNDGMEKRISGIEIQIKKIGETLNRQLDILEDHERLFKKLKSPSNSDEARNQQSAPARITVSLPAAAKLYVDGKLCPLTSNERTFSTSAVAPGQKYFHTLRVEMTSNGQPMNKSQQVVFEAGQHVQVNFNATSGEFTVVRD